MPFTNDPDYINSPDDCQTHYCHTCGFPIEDTTTAKQDWTNRRWFCESCVNQERAENVPQDWTERELVKVSWTPRVLNWKW